MFAHFATARFEGYRLDDSLYVRGNMVSLARLLLPRAAFRWLENYSGWNLLIKATK